jgi:hypothetical protein
MVGSPGKPPIDAKDRTVMKTHVDVSKRPALVRRLKKGQFTSLWSQGPVDPAQSHSMRLRAAMMVPMH